MVRGRIRLGNVWMEGGEGARGEGGGVPQQCQAPLLVLNTEKLMEDITLYFKLYLY